MTRLQIARVAFLSVVGLVVLFVIYTILKRPEPSSAPLVITLRPRPTAESATATPATINVYVSGAVNKPDVYALPLNSMVKEAVNAEPALPLHTACEGSWMDPPFNRPLCTALLSMSRYPSWIVRV